SLSVMTLPPVWEALRQQGSVAVLDGTGDPAQLGALLARPLDVVQLDVEDTADVRRTVLATRNATITQWCPGGKVNWNPKSGLRGGIRTLVAAIVADTPKGSTILWCTFRALSNALRDAWESPTAEGADLLAPLHAHGLTVRWTYYGAKDTRGANRHQDC